MSGGSYNYLYHTWDLSDLVQKKQDLADMFDRLAGLGYAQDAAKETYALLVQLRQFEIQTMVHVERLQELWKAIEWWDSADWGEDSVKNALAEYRKLEGES